MNDLISVVIPIYKVEEYINKCIDSVINQTYKKLEIILVDDGSPDNCPIICDNYAKKDNRIKVIHKKNGGLSDARNVGINASSGKYIIFVDSDDWIPLDSIEILYTNLFNNSADISSGSFKEVYTRDDICDDFKNNITVYNASDALEKLMNLHDFCNSANCKLYKKELFKDIEYPVGKHYEDLATTYKLFAKANVIVSTCKIVYYYYQNNNSIMHKKYSSSRLDALSFAFDEYDFIYNNYNYIVDSAIYRLFYECLVILYEMPLFHSDKKNVWKYIKQYRKKVIYNKKLNKKQKILCFSSYFGQIGIKFAFICKKILNRRG